MLYRTLIHPYLLYGSEAWFATHQNVVGRLVVLQKRACRTVCCLPFNDHTSTHFRKMNVLKLSDLHYFQTAVFAYKTIKMSLNYFLDSKLKYFRELHNYETRFNSQLEIPKYNRKTSQFCILYRTSKLWNNLPMFFLQRHLNSSRVDYCSILYFPNTDLVFFSHVVLFLYLFFIRFDFICSVLCLVIYT